MENKNTWLKVLVGILLILVIAMGGFIFYREVLDKKEEPDKIENKDATKKEEPDKIENKDATKKEDEINNVTNESKEYSVIKDKIKTGEENVVKQLKVNGRVHVLGYTFIDDEGAGLIEVTYDNLLIYSTTGAAGFGDLEYFIFEAKDGKEYVLIKYKTPGEYACLLDENGKILKEISNYVEDQYNEISCFAYSKGANEIIYIENGSVYYYSYNSLKSKTDYTANMNKIKIDINAGLISENNTGNQEIMQLGQCD